MPHPAPQLRRFLRRLHRRLVVLRAAEAGGIGLLAGSAFALVLAGLLLWLGRPAMPAAVASLALGAACGIVTGFARRPTLIYAALRADDQLRLDDLLSTALVVSRDPGNAAEPWAHTVLAMADARCTTLSPAAVLLRRFDGRAWGGISVAAGLALTLAAFSNGSADARAGDRSDPSRPGIAAHVPPMAGSSTPRTTVADAVARRRTWTDPIEAERPVAGGETDTTAADASTDPSQSADSSDRPGPGGAQATGDGASSSRDARPTPDPSQPTIDPSVRPRGAATDVAGAPVAGGVGGTATQAGTDGMAGGSADGGRTVAAPPWRAAGWAADVDAARAALQAGRVPDAYRDLVRDYFEAQ